MRVPISAPQSSQICPDAKRLLKVSDCVIALAPHIPGFAQRTPRSAGELRAGDFNDALSWMPRQFFSPTFAANG